MAKLEAYDPDARKKYDVPPGTYLCICKGAVDKPPFKESQYGNTDEPRLGWQFEVTTPGDDLGKIIEQETGTRPSALSGLVRLVNMLHGGAGIPKGHQIDPEDYRGRVYQINWQVNPESKKGRCHIAAAMEVRAAQTGGTPPPGPPLAASLSPRPEVRYWVLDGKGEVLGPVPASEVARRVEGGEDPSALELCPEGSEAWQTAAAAGFRKKPTPPAPPRPAAPPPPPRRPAPPAPLHPHDANKAKGEGHAVAKALQNPPQPAATPAPSIPKWWVKTDAPGIPDEDDGCELMDPVALSQWANAQKPPRSAESIRVCPEGGGASDFRTAAEAGLKVDAPF